MCTTCNKLWLSVCTVQSRPTFQDIGCRCTVSIEATVTKILDTFITVGSVKTLQLYFSRNMCALTTSCECLERSHWSVTCKDTIIHRSCLLDSSCQCYLTKNCCTLHSHLMRTSQIDILAVVAYSAYSGTRSRCQNDRIHITKQL